MFKKLNSFAKDVVYATRIGYIFYPFRHFLVFLSNVSEISVWIHKNKKGIEKNDFFRWKRNYHQRLDGFEFILKKYDVENVPVSYMEFGVASGDSFSWWLNRLKNKESSFWGFDTFEGLPEDWGLFFKKGAMAHHISKFDDARYIFVKGIFQDTLVKFIKENQEVILLSRRKIIHLDADLFSATVFVLSQLYPYLNNGDILIFDEFSVPNSEFYALKIFQDCFYIKLKPVCATNNFYQTIFEVEK
ncbi:MAG: hypothetical protein JSS67_12540 [Bacteroidetes bacterium]|nr:hypothetical protein [Bacteroidota bacterium]